MSELKRGARVVVEAADEPVIQRKRHADFRQNLLHRRKVLTRVVSEKLRDARQVFNDRLILGYLAVKHAQRIRHGSPLAVATHLSYDGLQRLAQRLIERRTILRTA